MYKASSLMNLTFSKLIDWSLTDRKGCTASWWPCPSDWCDWGS